MIYYYVQDSFLPVSRRKYFNVYAARMFKYKIIFKWCMLKYYVLLLWLKCFAE